MEEKHNRGLRERRSNKARDAAQHDRTGVGARRKSSSATLPRMRVALSLVLVCSWSWGCAGTDSGGGGGGEGAGASASLVDERPDEPDSTRASREAASAATSATPATTVDPSAAPGVASPTSPTAPTPTPTAPVAPTEERRLLTVTPIEIAEAEDGQGRVIAATNAIAFDLDARRFPPGGIDPVLHVGELDLRRYEHPRLGVLRFVCADRSLLTAGAPVFVQYGNDPSTRVVVSNGLVLP